MYLATVLELIASSQASSSLPNRRGCYVDYEPGAKELDDVLWEPEWDDEGNDGEFLKIIKEELQKNASKK
jgi:hypothetical protein